MHSGLKQNTCLWMLTLGLMILTCMNSKFSFFLKSSIPSHIWQDCKFLSYFNTHLYVHVQVSFSLWSSSSFVFFSRLSWHQNKVVCLLILGDEPFSRQWRLEFALAILYKVKGLEQFVGCFRKHSHCLYEDKNFLLDTQWITWYYEMVCKNVSTSDAFFSFQKKQPSLTNRPSVCFSCL